MFKYLYKINSFILLAITFGIVFFYSFVEQKNIVANNFSIISKKDSIKFTILGVSFKNEIVAINENTYIRNYLLIGDTAQLVKINSKIIATWEQTNLQKVEINNFQNVPDSIKSNKGIYSIKGNIISKSSKLPMAKKYLNWRGDISLLKNCFLHPLFIFVLLIIILKNKIVTAFQNKKYTEAAYYSNFWAIVICLFVTIFFIYISLSQTYFFNQDDNYAQFTPVMLHGLTNWYHYGTMPTYNPYQYAGVPTLEISTYAFFYPITHIAFLFSKYILHNTLYFTTVFIGIHFVSGSFFVFKIMQHYRVYVVYEIAATIGFIFCGFNIEATRSWYYIAPSILFLPLLYWLLIIGMQNKKLTCLQLVFVGLLIALYAYGANLQFMVYTVALLTIFFLALAPFNFLKKIKYLIIIFCFAVVFYLPQLLMSFYALKNVDRNVASGSGILNGFCSLFFPFFSIEHKPNLWGSIVQQQVSNYFYQGPVFFIGIAFVFLIIYFIKNKSFKNKDISQQHSKILSFIFLLVLLLSFGRSGIIWVIQSKLPILNKFSLPFKFLFFVQFFGVILGAFVLQQLQLKYKSIIATFSITITIFCALHNCDAFYLYKNNNYASQNILQKIKSDNNYRIISFAPLRSENGNYNIALTNNLATQYQIASVQGYEPLFQNNLNTLQNLNQLSTKYFIVSNVTSTNPYFVGIQSQASKYITAPNVQLIYADSTTKIYQNNNALPICVAYNNDSILQTNPEISNRNNGVFFLFNTPIVANKITLSFALLNGLKVFVNGKKQLVQKDAFGCIQFKPTETIKTIQTIYCPFPFNKL